MHEYTYQAMVYDILPTKNEKVYLRYENRYDRYYDDEKNTVILNESEDAIWDTNRHLHIGEVCTQLPKEMARFKKENRMARMEDERGQAEREGQRVNISTRQLSSALSDYTKYVHTINLLSKHLRLSSECLEKSNQYKLQDIANLEQNLVCNFDEEHNQVSMRECIKDLHHKLSIPTTGSEERMRLLLL
uniref:Protein ROP n=1 Tax=Lygus hesperus TaxID=30085 RepID=A0A146LSV1_LYGHE